MKKILTLLGIAVVAYIVVRSVLSMEINLFPSQQVVENSSFERSWKSWLETGGPKGEGTAISNEGRTGNRSAKITDTMGRFEQIVPVEPSTSYKLVAYVYGSGKIGVIVSGKTLTAETNGGLKDWVPVSLNFETADEQQVVIFGAYRDSSIEGVRATARFDDFAIEAR